MKLDNLLHQYISEQEDAILIEDGHGVTLYSNGQWDELTGKLTISRTRREEMRQNTTGCQSKTEKHRGNHYLIQVTPFANGEIFLWVIKNITDIEQLRERCYVLETMLNQVDEAVIHTDPTGLITFYNHSHELLDHKSAQEMVGHYVNEVYKEEIHTRVEKNRKAICDLYHRYLLKDGSVVNTLSSTIPIQYRGESLGVYSVSRDITHIRELMLKTAELQQQIEGKTGRKNGTRYTFENIIGESVAMHHTKREAQRLALSSSPLMLYGETGTGKELFAQAIHNASLYANEPFVAINCAAMPENLLESTLFGTTKGSFTGAENATGLLEQAGKGTFFLDEINAMPLAMQSKLLRVLQEKRVRKVGGVQETPIFCRIITACNEPPEECVNQGTLRLDLFYRLAILRINIPPLRHRGGDIILLAKYFAEKISKLYHLKHPTFSDEFLTYLTSHNWPGNVRQLEFTIEGAIVSADKSAVLKVEKIPRYMMTAADFKTEHEKKTQPSWGGESLNQVLLAKEKDTIKTVLDKNKGNISQTARDLGLSRQNLQYRLKKLHLHAKGN